MSDINLEISKLVMPIINLGTKNIAGQALILSFPNGEKSMKPYLVFPRSIIDKNMQYAIDLKIENEKKIELNINEEFCKMYELGKNEIVAFPFGGLLNYLLSQKSKVDFKAISKTNISDFDPKKIPSQIEMLTCIKCIKVSGKMRSATFKRFNILPFFEDCKINDEFYIDLLGQNSLGAPVLLFNEGSYFANNSLCIGQRLAFLGIVIEHNEDYEKVVSFKKVFELIENKYSKELSQNF